MSQLNNDYDLAGVSWNPNSEPGKLIDSNRKRGDMLSIVTVVATILSLLLLFQPKIRNWL